MKNKNISIKEQERRDMIGEASKEHWKNPLYKEKWLTTRMQMKKERGYINSPEARKKLAEIQKKKWVKGEVTRKQKQTLFKKGFDIRRVNTQFKRGHLVLDKTRQAVKLSRAKQIQPKFDTSIEIKVQNFLKQLGIEYFTHQYIKEIEHGYQCDILIPSMNLIIECDGNYWHKYPIRTDIDNIRTKELIDKGFKVLRLWESEINEMDLNEFKLKIEEVKNGN